MGARNSFYVKSIATYAPDQLLLMPPHVLGTYIISFLAIVLDTFKDGCSWSRFWFYAEIRRRYNCFASSSSFLWKAQPCVMQVSQNHVLDLSLLVTLVSRLLELQKICYPAPPQWSKVSNSISINTTFAIFLMDLA